MGYEQQVFFNCKVCCMPLITTSNEPLCCLYKVLSLYKEHIKRASLSLFTCPSLEKIQDKGRAFLFNLNV